jgi:hypothetical protein
MFFLAFSVSPWTGKDVSATSGRAQEKNRMGASGRQDHLMHFTDLVKAREIPQRNQRVKNSPGQCVDEPLMRVQDF